MEESMKFKPSFEYKLIYIFRINDGAHTGYLKIGDATIHTNKNYDELLSNSHDLNYAAKMRINNYTSTAGIDYELLHTEIAVYKNNDKNSKKYGKVLAFRDHEVHKVLTRSGILRKVFDTDRKQNEWFKCDLETAKLAIKAVKDSKTALDNKDITVDKNPIIFRPEQKEAIQKTLKQFKHSNRMLWNAKMRFGKTLTALEVVKRSEFKRTIIITHRPVVSDGWYEDFSKIFYDTHNYEFGSKTHGKTIEELIKSNKNFVYFASMQDLRGSEKVGGNFDKNNIIFKINWDFVVVDEAHEGTKTKLGQAVLEAVIKPNDKEHITKTLELSGTPFNLLVDYEEDEIYTWDYIMEQEAKLDWTKNHYCDSNPYDELPKMNIYTYHLEETFKNYIDAEDKAFNFREFFRTWTGDIDKDWAKLPTGASIGDFVHEQDIKSFLNLICHESDKTCYPFASDEYRSFFKHTLWMLPGVKEAKAFSKLLREHPVFSQFEIINVAGDGDEEIDSSNALNEVKKAMGVNPDETRTITLSCGRLTTGVSVPEWTAVLMLAGSYSTQASQYLQTIFRVQTPANINGKIKENCYVFDFAPDRTLKMVAESVQLSQRGTGTLSAEFRLQKFLNFCPVISLSETSMKEYKVSYLLQELKKAYAERVVRNGFDDTRLYNDELLKLDEVDLKEFERLKGIIGSSPNQEKMKNIDINDEGFTDEEYEKLKRIERKSKKELTEEEKQKLEELKKKKKERWNAISILRGISIRIPLLVYGADVPINREISIDEFPELVDDASWQEFMPKGITKNDFRKFSKYYDKEVFVASTYRIRYIAKTADELEPTERVKKIAQLFNTFKNPDKETVLTPWRVVNLHLSETIGGYCFWDEEFNNEIDEPREVIIDNITSSIFNEKSNVLEINSKTGLYPLYMTYSFYREASKNIIKEELTFEKKKEIWNKVLINNLYIICKTPMAREITKRTLLGYTNGGLNTHVFNDLIMQMKEKQAQLVKKIMSPNFWGKGGKEMKFNAVVGNPPYQQEIDNSHRPIPLYHHFYEAAFKISDFVSLISPARFLFNAGLTPSEWNKKMLNDEHFKVVKYYKDSHEVFPSADIKGGVIISIRNSNFSYGAIKHFADNPILDSIINKVLNKSNKFLSSIVFGKSTYNLLPKIYEDYPEYKESLTKGNELIFDASIFSLMPSVFKKEINNNENYLLVYGRKSNQRVAYYINACYVKDNDNLNSYKVILPGANGTGKLGEKLGVPFVGKPKELYTQTFMSIGCFSSADEATNLIKYLKTKFLRIMLGTLKVTQNTAKDTWGNVPLIDFENNSIVNWDETSLSLDGQLFKYFELNDEEIKFIENTADEMK